MSSDEEDNTVARPKTEYPPLRGTLLEFRAVCYRAASLPPVQTANVAQEQAQGEAAAQVGPAQRAAPVRRARAPFDPALLDPIFERLRPITHLATQVDSVRDVRMQGLPEAVYRTYEGTRFVLNWLTANNLDPRILNDFKSAMKLDELVRHAVIAVGDELYLPGPAGVVATITAITPKKAITVTIAANGAVVLQGTYANPKPLLEAMQATAPAPATSNQCWTAIFVRRQGVHLGSLHDLRQLYHRFKFEMDGWTEYKRDHGMA